MFKKSGRDEAKRSKVLDVDANMQGKLVFRDAVDLRINGDFEGSLDTKGTLIIGEAATVNAEIKGEDITVSGKVVGDIVAASRLELSATAKVIGDINTPALKMEEGAILQGSLQMVESGEASSGGKKKMLNRGQLAEYLEVDLDTVDEWIKNKKIPYVQESGEWKFDKAKIDAWVTTEKIK